MHRRFFVGLGLCLALLAALPAAAAITVKTANLGHGVEAWYAPNAAVPVVDIILSFEGAGAASDPAEKTGLAAFSAAMLTEGAGNLNAQAFARALDEYAISISMRADDDRLTVHVYCLREHAAKAGELLALSLSQPTLAEPDMARVKGQIRSLLTQLQERPGYQADRLVTARVFKDHPYANPTYGTAATVSAFTAQDVRDYLAAHVTRGNVIVSAAGDLDAGLLADMLRPVITVLQEKSAKAAPAPRFTMQGSGEMLRAEKNVPQTVVNFAAPAIDREDTRFYAAYLLNEILGGNTLTSRLGSEVRQKKGLVYGINTDLEVRRGGSLLTGQFATRNSTAEQAVGEVKAVLAALQQRGVTTDECNDAKSYVLGHFPLQLDRTGNISAMLLTMQLYHLGKDYMDDRDALFGKVTCGDINALAGELLAPEKFLFAIVGGKADAEAPPATPPAAPGHGGGDVR